MTKAAQRLDRHATVPTPCDNAFRHCVSALKFRGGRSALVVAFAVFDNSRLAPWAPTNGTRPFN
jgi:hypothetical protein